jgi:phosphoribosylformylglycinamidine synthase
MYELHKKDLFSACCSIEAGGLCIALAKMAIAGQLGCTVNISKLRNLTLIEKLFSESQSRFIVTVAPEDVATFEELMSDQKIVPLGTVTQNGFVIADSEPVISTTVDSLSNVYRERFKNE